MKLKEIREMYPEGTQIVLTEMAGESQMPYGLKGTVKFVDDAGQIHMSWENGSSLALNINEDTFEKVEAPEKISVILVEPGRYPKLIEIEDTLEAMAGVVCDGAKPSCATRMYVALFGSLQAMMMAKEGIRATNVEGFVHNDLKVTLENLYRLQHDVLHNKVDAILWDIVKEQKVIH